jgi:hypothetical protein
MARGRRIHDRRDYGITGRHQTTNDCTVRALCVASGMEYDLCLIALAVAGRRKNSGVKMRDWFRVFQSLGLCKVEDKIKHVTRPTDQDLHNNVIVLIRGHVYSIRNGVHSDGSYGYLNNNRRVRMAWRIA